jgi:hypothetical protein
MAQDKTIASNSDSSSGLLRQTNEALSKEVSDKNLLQGNFETELPTINKELADSPVDIKITVST